MKKLLIIIVLSFSLWFVAGPVFARVQPSPESVAPAGSSIEALVGERLSYDVSFLWFDRLAEGTISLTRGKQPGTYVAVLEARTRGVAAFITRHRVERYQTIMEVGPDGFLRPLVYSSHTLKGQGADLREKETCYTFDYSRHQVKYQKIKNHVIRADEILPLQDNGQVFDILSAFYNLRIGSFGPFDKQQIHFPTIQRKDVEEIVVAPVDKAKVDNGYFADDNVLCKVLLDPEVFGTNGRDLLISFNENNQPQKAVVKNVVGLGDVRGVLRQAVTPVAQLD